MWWILCVFVGDNTVGVEAAEGRGLTALTCIYGGITLLGLRDNTLLLGSWVAWWCWLVWEFMPASTSGTWSHGRERGQAGLLGHMDDIQKMSSPAGLISLICVFSSHQLTWSRAQRKQQWFANQSSENIFSMIPTRPQPQAFQGITVFPSASALQIW